MAVADLSPKILPPLTTAAAEKKIVVLFIVGGGFCTIEDRHGRPFEANDNCGIALIGEDMTSQAIAFPAKALRVVEAVVDVRPFALAHYGHVSVACHPREADYRIFVSHIWARYVIYRPR